MECSFFSLNEAYVAGTHRLFFCYFGLYDAGSIFKLDKCLQLVLGLVQELSEF